MLRMGLGQLNLLSHRIKKYHNNLLYLRTSMVIAGICVMPLLGEIASLAWTICKQLEYFPAQKHYEHRERYCPEEACTCIAPLPEGYKRLIKWPKAGIGFGIIIFPTQSLQKLRVSEMGLKLLVNTSFFQVAEPNLRMVLFITLTSF